MFLEAGSNVILEDVAVLGECCPFGRDSLSVFVLAVVSGAVSLSQIEIAVTILYMSGVSIVCM